MHRFSRGFTLIELLIVIGILAILATTAVIVLNPTEFMKKSRDATRLSDLATVNKAISLYQTDGGTSYGDSTTVYVSIPDSSATCANLGLPSLPALWSYACALEDDYMKADGDGWIPIDFTSVSYGTVLSTLPVDPTNTVATGQYYTYVPGGSWKLAAMMESEKYSTNMNIDGGPDLGLYELGSDLALAPFQRGLVSYWKFDEGSGTTATDSSGNGNNGTLYASPTWTSGQVNGALNFDGVDDRVDFGAPTSLNIEQQSFTLVAWINPGASPDTGKYILGRQGYHTGLSQLSSQMRFGIWDGGSLKSTDSALGSISVGIWYFVVGTYDIGSKLEKLYIDGVYTSERTISAPRDLTLDWWAGNMQANSTYAFNGVIDEARIYNRALSASEIKSIYDATK